MSNQQQFGPWEVKKEIGRGADGICCKVVKDSYYYVLKIPADAHSISHLLNEIRVLSEINHPNIISLVDCCLDINNPWMVTKYHGHGILHDFKFKGWGSSKLNNFNLQISNTVAWLHSKGIAHGNLSRSNLLISNDHRPILIDFAQCLQEGNEKFETRRAIDMYDMGMLFAWTFSARAKQFTKESYSYKTNPVK